MELSNKTQFGIKDIEALTEEQAFILAEERQTVKGHTVYFVDFGGYFGYSRVVFYDGAHIKYANDYQLHHSGRSKEELHDLYIQGLDRKLFTDEELTAPIKDYADYQARSYFLHNLYGLRKPSVSAFRICSTKEQEKAFDDDVSGMVLNIVAFAYYAPEYRDFVIRHCQLFKAVEQAKEETLNNFDYWKAAFLHEMYNHEYGINWQADFDVISCFADVDSVKDYESVKALLAASGFTDTQKAAYYAARVEYWQENQEE